MSKLKLYKYDYKSEFADVNGGLKSDFGESWTWFKLNLAEFKNN